MPPSPLFFRPARRPDPPNRRGSDTHHQSQHQRADALADLGRDVVAELLQRRQEALEFAELPGAAGRRQLLVGQRGRGGGAGPVAVAVRGGGGAVEGRRRVTAAVGYCVEQGKRHIWLNSKNRKAGC